MNVGTKYTVRWKQSISEITNERLKASLKKSGSTVQEFTRTAIIEKLEREDNHNK